MRTLFPIAVMVLVGCGPRQPSFDHVNHLKDGDGTNLEGAYSVLGKSSVGHSDVCGLVLREDHTFSITNIPALTGLAAPVFWFDGLTTATVKWQIAPVGSYRGERVLGIAFSMPGSIYPVFAAFSGRSSPYRLAILHDARNLNSSVEFEFQRAGL